MFVAGTNVKSSPLSLFDAATRFLLLLSLFIHTILSFHRTLEIHGAPCKKLLRLFYNRPPLNEPPNETTRSKICKGNENTRTNLQFYVPTILLTEILFHLRNLRREKFQ